MKRRNKTGVRFRRLWALALAAGLVCALVGTVSAAPSLGAVSLPDASSPKPAVVIQGNVVVNKNKPTGFYELALCVRTARTVKKAGTNNLVPEATYAAELQAALESGKPEDRQALDAKYDVTYYPFQSAAATVHIDLDALTAVTWGSGKPVYADWKKGAGTAGNYPAAQDTGYPRGIDMTDPDNLENAALFTSLQKIIDAEEKDGNQDHVSVRLDTAKPDEVTNATALVEGYDAGSNTALLTLTANTTTTKNVIYEVPTPVVVVRFAYDLNRFENTEVGDPADLTATPNASDFWAGPDKNNRSTDDAARTALTYLAAGNGSASDPSYTTSDQEAAETSIHQAVWYEHNMASDQVNQETTQFYYYLGAEDKLSNAGTIDVNIPEDNGSGGWNVTKYSLVEPRTAGKTVLADKRSDLYATPGDPEAAGSKYSFFQNLLTMGEKTLRIELVNAETYRKPTGGGGINILFYDWDDSLIGSLIVDGGDVRSQVEEYVEENLVHPALRPSAALAKMGGKLPADGNYTTVDQQAYQTLINSLAREYTYRGKYAYQVGGDDTDLGVTDGEDYPLTNKLDYAFTKRVNTAAAYTVSDAGGGSHTETYVLPHKVTDADMVDAALYPYTYGWAVVEDTSAKDKGWKVMYDAKKIEDTWTTIGVGELSNVKPGYYDDGTATAQTLPTALGAAKYQAPAFLADEDPHWVDPAEPAQPGMSYTNKYAYQLNSNSSAGYFRFADFSDIDAELEQYQTAGGATKNTLIVKAVYEPGERLRTGDNYRMVQEPYYNKLNSLTASNGAAFSVDISLERSNIVDGVVYGVSRTRDPAIRQDTTVDQFWVENEEFDIKHDLPGATQAEANAKTETIFTNVVYDNGEIVRFRLILTARQQKVDYRLIETYGSNVVAGGQRSQTNVQQTGTAYVADNYNYFMEDSNSTDPYYDAPYADREGSHGFVLYGTLNRLMQYATMYNHNEIDTLTFNGCVSYANMADANLRSDGNGTVASGANQSAMRTALQDAARECETNHKGNPDYWNNDLDCAELTYHQLQWYIINGVLLDRATADDENHKLDFCHLHAACADLVSDKPKDWPGLVDAALNNPDAIDKLSLAEIETMTHLRSSIGGAAFGNVTTFKNRFVAAVTKLGEDDASWINIQKELLNGNGSIDTYWWYDGATVNSAPNNLTALGNLAQSALHAQTYPDGTTATTKAKLEAARSAFNANAAAGDNKVAAAWVRLTNNLVKAHQETEVGEGDDAETIYTHTKFDDFEEFLTAYLGALTRAETEGFGYGEGLTVPTWEGIQRAILHPDDPFDNSTDGTADADLWWKDGKTPLRVTSIGTLLRAAQYANSSDEDEKAMGEAALARVTLEMLKGEPYYLRATQKGGALDDVSNGGYADIAALLTDIKAAQAAGANSWDSLQYYLIHKTVDDVDVMNRERRYYWWKNGGIGIAVDFASASDLDGRIAKLMEASVRVESFGDPEARKSVENQKGEDGSYFKFSRWTTADPDTATHVSQLSKHTDTDALIHLGSELAAFMRQHTGGSSGDIYTIPNVTWHQAQYWILEGQYLDMTQESALAVIEAYWWYDKDEKPKEEEGKNKEPSDPLADAILVWCQSAKDTAADNALKAAVKRPDLNSINNIYISKTGGTLPSSGKNAATQLNAAKTKLLNLAKAVVNSEYYDAEKGTVTLYWAQIQYWYVGNTLLSNKDALDKIVNEWNWSKADGSGSVKKIPDEVDLSVLNP